MAGDTDSGFLTLLEAVDKRARITTTGSEIVTTLYCEPASAAPIVVCRLLGSVTGNAKTDTRKLPAADHDYPFMYCVEAHPTPFDRRAVASSPALLLRKFGGNAVTVSDIDDALTNPIIFDGPQSIDTDGTYATSQAQQRNMCGAYIEAVYRPLSTIYSGSTDGAAAANAFDYLDPQFYPCSRTIAAGDALVVWSEVGVTADHVAVGGAGIRTDTWQELTIRRIMVPMPPWDTIRQLTNRINGQQAWTPGNMVIPGLPSNTFPKGTLRFDSVEPIKRVIPMCLDADGTTVLVDDNGLPITKAMQWWDLVYKFSWRTTFDVWQDVNGESQAASPLNWNIEWFNGRITFVPGRDDIYPGWCEVQYEQAQPGTNLGKAFDWVPKYPNAEDSALPINAALVAGANHPFDQLFIVGAP